MSNLDELERLLEHYGSGHEDDGHGGCVLCTVYVPHTDDERIRVRYPCAFAALPALIAAARRAEALEKGLDEILNTDSFGAWDGWREVARLRDIARATLAGEGAPR